MPSLFRYRLLPVAAILFLASGISACTPLCQKWMNDVWVGSAYTLDYGSPDYREPVNTWIDNPKMAAFLADSLQRQGKNALVYWHGFKFSPKPDGNCPDCVVCTLSLAGVIGHDCQPDGDLFVKAEIGPGTSVRAMTYWRR